MGRISVASKKYGVKCPKDGSREIWKTGFVPTSEGRKSRFKCTVCAHTFYLGQPGTVVGEQRQGKPVHPAPKGKKRVSEKVKNDNTQELFD